MSKPLGGLDWERESGQVFSAYLHVVRGTGALRCDVCGNHTRGWGETFVVEIRVNTRPIGQIDVCSRCIAKMCR